MESNATKTLLDPKTPRPTASLDEPKDSGKAGSPGSFPGAAPQAAIHVENVPLDPSDRFPVNFQHE